MYFNQNYVIMNIGLLIGIYSLSKRLNMITLGYRPIGLLRSLNNLMPGLHLQLNRRKSRAPPPTQPSLIFKDLRRLSCRWSPTFTTVALLVEPDLNELKYE